MPTTLSPVSRWTCTCTPPLPIDALGQSMTVRCCGKIVILCPGQKCILLLFLKLTSPQSGLDPTTKCRTWLPPEEFLSICQLSSSRSLLLCSGKALHEHRIFFRQQRLPKSNSQILQYNFSTHSSSRTFWYIHRKIRKLVWWFWTRGFLLKEWLCFCIWLSRPATAKRFQRCLFLCQHNLP